MMRFSLKVTSMIISLIHKFIGLKVSFGGAKIPPKPVLFVANHFTRFETFVLPYVLYKNYQRQTRSLADSTVFVGLLGKFMRWVGTISSKNRDRDCIIVEDLMMGKEDWLIYPEGYMVKNKYISFEEGTFYTHSTEEEGPIHTGSAVMALKAQILQLKARRDNRLSLNPFCHTKVLNSENFDKIIDVKIVPICITYYPIRSGESKFLLWLDKHFNLRNTRLFEELEIEINLLKSAHMNIKIGEAIEVKEYMPEFLVKEQWLDESKKVDVCLETKRKTLTNDMMKSLYLGVEINFDHLFILSLSTLSMIKISPLYLRLLIYKNMRDIRAIEKLNIHKDLEEETFELLINPSYSPFISVLNVALEQQILYQDCQGEYLFDKVFLEKKYAFHQVRVKNTLQVILNEIRWQDKIVKIANANASLTQKALKESHFNHLKERELVYYYQEYQNHFKSFPSRKSKGAPIILINKNNSVGLVFSHGYLASPKEVEGLAEYLFSKGVNVYVPRLRGHGTDPQALLAVTSQDWEIDYKRAFTAMRQCSSKVFIGGFSTGGLLALIHASSYEVDGIIVLNSALKLHDLRVSYVVPTLYHFNEMIQSLHAKGILNWIDNAHTEQPLINYDKHPLASVYQLEKIMKKTAQSLRRVTSPILIIQGDNDPIVNAKSAYLIYDKIESLDKTLIFLKRSRHNILATDDSYELFKLIWNFIKRLK